MSRSDDLEDKSASAQSRRSKLQRMVRGALLRGTRELQKRMDAILKQMAYMGGFNTKTEARQWLKSPAGTDILVMVMDDARSLHEPERTMMLNAINRKAYGHRFNRANALKSVYEIGGTKIAQTIVARSHSTLSKVAEESFGRAIFDIQKQTARGFKVEAVPYRMLERAVNSRLTVTRADGYVKSVTMPMREALFTGIMLGKSREEIARDVKHMSGKSAWVSKAFSRTALTEVSNEAEKKSLEEAGLKKYRFVATLDERTCPVCGGMDGRVFYLKDAQAGKNFPPMHRNCRCVHTAVLTDEIRASMKRRARDSAGEDILVPQSMTYEEWARRYLPKK